MNLYFDPQLAQGYKSQAQIVRVLSEHWLKTNVSCINCGAPLTKTGNNSPARDFNCSGCRENYELKSHQGTHAPRRINNGAYHTLLARLRAADNPNFLILSYRAADYAVQQLTLIPKHYLTEEHIRQRKPLTARAKRQDWIGSTIDLTPLPASGKILLIDRMQPIDRETVRQQWRAHLFLRDDTPQKTWLLAVMRCLEELPDSFTLADCYRFVPTLQRAYPNNRNIEAKIRQQLQTLRDWGQLTFLGRGRYQKSQPQDSQP